MPVLTRRSFLKKAVEFGAVSSLAPAAGIFVSGCKKGAEFDLLITGGLVCVGSDGSALAPYGPLARGKPHPRNYGTFPRLLGKYVREEKITALAEMSRKITSMPAAQFGFQHRGLIKAGWAADITEFDPGKIADRVTWTEPAVYPDGISFVIVNGQTLIDGGEHTGSLPGRVLRIGQGGNVS